MLSHIAAIYDIFNSSVFNSVQEAISVNTISKLKYFEMSIHYILKSNFTIVEFHNVKNVKNTEIPFSNRKKNVLQSERIDIVLLFKISLR